MDMATDSMHDHHHHHHMHHGDDVTTAATPHDHHGMDHGGHGMDHSGHGMDHSGHGMDHSGHGMSHGGMMMYFHFSSSSTILFKGWETTDWIEMLFSCLAVFIMASLYEGLKVWREVLLRKAQHSARYNVQVPTTEDAAIVNHDPSIRTSMLSLAHAIQTVLHVLQVVVSYFLMLIFMTYNVYLCLAVALGAGLGYFLFAWKRTMIADINEHCH